jgi:hypothetical protein
MPTQGDCRSLLREMETRAKERNCTQMILVTELDRTMPAFYDQTDSGGDQRRNNKKLDALPNLRIVI